MIHPAKWTTAKTGNGRSAPTGWRWSVGSVEDALAEAGDQWHRLALTSEAPPTALPLWCASLNEAFGDIEGPVLVHRLYAGSRLAAVLPLTFRGGMCRTWRAYQHLWYTPLWAFALDPQVKGIGPEIRRHLLAHAEVLDLKYLLADSACVACLLEGMDPHSVLVEKDPDAADAYQPLNLSWEECLAHASPSLIQDIRKSIRQLQKKGQLALEIVTGGSDLDGAMTECLELEEAGWKGRNGTAIASLPRAERFYRALARRAAEAGLLVINMLRLNRRLIAFDLCLRTRRRLDSLKIAYDEELARQSPGNVTAYLVLERECATGESEGLHLGHPSPAKSRWTPCRNELVRIVLFADTWRGRCSHAAHAYLRPLVREVRRRLGRTAGEQDNR